MPSALPAARTRSAQRASTPGRTDRHCGERREGRRIGVSVTVRVMDVGGVVVVVLDAVVSMRV
jgi:hypothetical protein